MFRTSSSKEGKERRRFYLLPGMGGGAYRRKQRRILRISILVGLIASALFALAAYFLNRHPL